MPGKMQVGLAGLADFDQTPLIMDRARHTIPYCIISGVGHAATDSDAATYFDPATNDLKFPLPNDGNTHYYLMAFRNGSDGAPYTTPPFNEGGDVYVVEWQGAPDTVTSRYNTATVALISAGRAEFTIKPGSPADNQQVAFAFTSPTALTTPFRLLRIYLKENEADVTAGKMLSAVYRQELSRFRCARFMDLQETNWINGQSSASKASTFAEMNRTEARVGWSPVPLSALCKVANEAGVEGWFNLPHRFMTDSTGERPAEVDAYAAYVRDNCAATAWFELSNEVWNDGAFLQAGEFVAYANRNGITSKNQVGLNNAAYGYASANAMKRIRDVYGVSNRSRWKGVLNIQSVFFGRQDDVLYTAKQRAIAFGLQMTDLFDAVAIAPYFGYDAGEDRVWYISNVTKAANAVVRLPRGDNGNTPDPVTALPAGRQITFDLVNNGSGGMSQIHQLVGTVTGVQVEAGTNDWLVTTNIDSSGFSNWNSSFYATLFDYRIVQLMDLSVTKNQQSPARYPYAWSYWAEDLKSGVLASNGVPASGLGKTATSSNIPQRQADISAAKTLAASYGLPLISYESGCHVLPAGPLIDRIANKTIAPRWVNQFYLPSGHGREMADLFRASFAAWEAANPGGMLAQFQLDGRCDRYGLWSSVPVWPTATNPTSGILSPRHRALRDYNEGRVRTLTT